jgi:tetratricopeptide (TPR) repeat protein
MKFFARAACLAMIMCVPSTAIASGNALPSPTPGPAVNGNKEGNATFSDPGRESALVRMLEGQRHLWRSQRLRSQAGRVNSMQLAKKSFEEAIALDPSLAEGYTALSELSVTLPPGDMDLAIRLSTAAVNLDGNSFGARRLLARLYTVKSRLNNGKLDQEFAEKAVSEWNHVTRLDPRNAEGWAFLSAFGNALGQTDLAIDALRKWVSSAPPLDVQFYRRVMGPSASLEPESANINLAAALAATGKRDEAARILSGLIADDPDNGEAVALFGDLVETAEGDAANAAAAALRQAIFANPGSVSLLELLSRLYVRLGRENEAVSILSRQAETLRSTDPRAVSATHLTIGDLLVAQDKYEEATNAYERALNARAISSAPVADAEDREFATLVFEKLIHLSKLSGKPEAASTVVDSAGRVLGKGDPFPERQNIMLLQRKGAHSEALVAIRSLRTARPDDHGLVRLEASVIAAAGDVDRAVALIRSEKSPRPKPAAASGDNETISISVPQTDEFSDLIFIANLYIRSGLVPQALTAISDATSKAVGKERKQIARLTLASAQQAAGDLAAAEATLRTVLTESPGNPDALNNLGYLLAEKGEKLTEAVEMIRQALKVDPQNPAYLDSLGMAFLKLGRVDEAEKYLRTAFRLDADSAAIHEHIGDLLHVKKQQQKAKASWEQALRLSIAPNDRSRIQMKIGKTAK